MYLLKRSFQSFNSLLIDTAAYWIYKNEMTLELDTVKVEYIGPDGPGVVGGFGTSWYSSHTLFGITYSSSIYGRLKDCYMTSQIS